MQPQVYPVTLSGSMVGPCREESPLLSSSARVQKSLHSDAFWSFSPERVFLPCLFRRRSKSVLRRYNLFPLRGLSYRYGGSFVPFSPQESDLQTRTRDRGTFMNPLLATSRSARPLRPPPLRSVLA